MSGENDAPPTGGWGWSPIVDRTRSQLGTVTEASPKSGDDTYLACLSKVDWDQTAFRWFLFFDMVPAEAALLAMSALATPGLPPPATPMIYFHATDAIDGIVLQSLGLKSDADLAEASWYILQLAQGGDRSTAVVGDLYHPDLGIVSDTAPDYGEYQIVQAELIGIPYRKGPRTLIGPPSAPSSGRDGARADDVRNGGMKRSRSFVALDGRDPLGAVGNYVPRGRYKRLRAVAPPPVAPPISAVGVMDVGQGGCNLLIDNHHEPTAYYDTGYPLNFFVASLPPNMRRNNPAFTGPIYQNTGGTLEVVLSHWDYDHWALGRYVAPGGQSLSLLPWTVPTQPLSPTQAQFLATLNVAILPPGFAVQAGPGGSTLYECTPPIGAVAGMILNNSGIALRFDTWLPVAGQVSRGVLLTADANFTSLPALASANLAGVGAVHHGSSANGALGGMPLPLPAVGGGYVAYSYGISGTSGNHAYGFPTAAAVAAYQAAGWTAPREQSTAEAGNLNAVPSLPQNHGNIRMGDQTNLPGVYNGSAFWAIGHALQ